MDISEGIDGNDNTIIIKQGDRGNEHNQTL